jgi:hypothetical protein
MGRPPHRILGPCTRTQQAATRGTSCSGALQTHTRGCRTPDSAEARARRRTAPGGTPRSGAEGTSRDAPAPRDRASARDDGDWAAPRPGAPAPARRALRRAPRSLGGWRGGEHHTDPASRDSLGRGGSR